MCGIAGIARRAPTAALEIETQRMLDALAHRGPDDAGILSHAPGNGSAAVALGARRLAILDLTPAGHQPMESVDGRFAIVLNGEIYNYIELRRQLQELGHAFRSRSDTEVLLAAFAQWGTDCWRRLIGMFACAILDRTSRRLSLARDPFGMKPLYYVTGRESLTFASEIPPLLSPTARANAQRLYDYLDLGISDHGGETMFTDVHAMPAAHHATIDLAHPDVVAPVRYWSLDPGYTAELSFEDAAKRLRELFLESITLHLRSDVQVGAALSGGTDSSSIVMAMRHIAGPQLDLHTFSYIGGQGAISEEPWIDIVNAAARATSHKVHLTPEEWSTDATRLVETQNEPFGSIAIYAQNRVFRQAAAAGIKVMLGGQGADELLAGYRGAWVIRLVTLVERGQWGEAVGYLRRLSRLRQPHDPSLRRVVLLALRRALPQRVTALGRRLLGRWHRPWIDRAWCKRHGVVPDGRDPGPSSAEGRLRSEQILALTRYSLPALLRYEDRNAMSYSVESRLPYLTPALAHFALALPSDYLAGPDGKGKRVFREAMRGIVPDAILDRRDKIGFSVPLQSWALKLPAAAELLDAVQQCPAIDPRGIAPLLAAIRANRSLPLRESFLVWRLMGLAAWARRFGVTFTESP